MPTLHVRGVPEEVYEDLRSYAGREGTSINGAVIRILEEHLDRERQDEDVVRRLLERAGKSLLPPGAPMPEEIIRRDRDSH